jgi:membrane protease YdiL (CAAX protease family)
VFFGFLRVWTGSVWPVAIAHAAANNAWEIMTELTQTKSPLVLEYVGGESGMIMIAGLLIVDIVLIRYMRSAGFRPKLSARS